jgi:5-hydroxyisourate hydrolase
MGKLTTHVLDTASGNPASGVRIRLIHEGQVLADTITNTDGRCDSPLLTDASAGTYQLIFSIGNYFRAHGTPSSFLDEIPIHFTIEAGRDYHVPLACSPYAYSTYRGS